MIWLYVQAPFAAFRTFTAGSFRPTAPTMTPSAAYGLLLNLAGIEMRHDDGKGYDLRLMSVDATHDLEDEGRHLVIVALVGPDLHIRIFDDSGEIVVDKPESELVAGETLTALKQRLIPFPDESGLSRQDKQEIISEATSIAGHTHGKAPMTLIGRGLPGVEIALGSMAETEEHTLFQQLHNYPVGTSQAEHAPACKGNKYNIAPVRRAFISNLRICLGLRGNESLEKQVREGLAGRGPARYGLPFLGDNNFLPDRIDLLTGPREARWLIPTTGQDDALVDIDPMRLTVTIDRSDMSRTATSLFRVCRENSAVVPEEAWIHVAYG